MYCALVADRHGGVGRGGVHAFAVVENLDLSEAIVAGQQPDRDSRRTGVDAVVDEVGDRRLQGVVGPEALDQAGVGSELDPLDDVVRGVTIRRPRSRSCRSRGPCCSQIRRTVHPMATRCRSVSRSRSMLRSAFAAHQALLVVGRVLCSGQPCQKHPSTNTATAWSWEGQISPSARQSRDGLIDSVSQATSMQEPTQRHLWCRVAGSLARHAARSPSGGPAGVASPRTRLPLCSNTGPTHLGRLCSLPWVRNLGRLRV